MCCTEYLGSKPRLLHLRKRVLSFLNQAQQHQWKPAVLYDSQECIETLYESLERADGIEIAVGPLSDDSAIPSCGFIEDLALELRERLHLNLFGFDLLLPSPSLPTCAYVVDINYFPSYNQVPEFRDLLQQHIYREYKNRQLNA